MLSDGVAPSAPNVYPVYRAFYVVPADVPLPKGLVRIDYFRTTSIDDNAWPAPTYLESGDGVSGWYAIDQGLDTSLFYAYYCVYVFSDGSKTGFSGMTEAGQAQLLATTTLSEQNVDSIAASAFQTGLVTSGIFRGVEFQTSNSNPRVQMDPTGIWATDSIGNNTFFLSSSTGQLVLAGSVISGGSISGTTIQGSTFYLPDSSAVYATPGNPSKLAWTPDGTGGTTVTSDVFGYSNPSTGSAVAMRSFDPNGNPQAAQVQVIANNSGGQNVAVSAGGQGRNVIDSSGASSFLQLMDGNLPWFFGDIFMGNVGVETGNLVQNSWNLLGTIGGTPHFSWSVVIDTGSRWYTGNSGGNNAGYLVQQSGLYFILCQQQVMLFGTNTYAVAGISINNAQPSFEGSLSHSPIATQWNARVNAMVITALNPGNWIQPCVYTSSTGAGLTGSPSNNYMAICKLA